MGIGDFFAAAQIAELGAERRRVAQRGGLAHVQADERLLEFDVVQLHPGIFVEGGVVRGQAVGRLEGAAGLLRIAFPQSAVAGRHQLLSLFRPFLLLSRLISEISWQIDRGRGRNDFLLLQLQRTGPVFDAPFVAEGDAPGDVLEREVELGGQ